MDEPQWVDELYTAFWRTLPGMLHAEAQGLAHTLGLAPSRDVPWSAVFSNEVTLAIPALLAEAMPNVRGSTVQDALLAHLLAVVDAFGTDRIRDGQVRPTWQMEAVLAQARRARDEAILRVAPGLDDPAVDFRKADEATLVAVETERRVLSGGEPADLSRYYAVSLGKQWVGFPASMALAHAAGWSAAQRKTLSRMLASIWIGLQLHDDVMDWQDDHQRGGAWAVTLASEQHARRGRGEERDLASGAESYFRAPSAVSPSTTPPWGIAVTRAPSEPPSSGVPSTLAPVRRLVFESGVLATMLSGARRCFRAARLRAAVLGARRIASWAEEREAQAEELARCEASSPGYASRAHALSAWARTVLA